MTALSTRTLGRTGVTVTQLGFGAMELRGQPTAPDLSVDDAAKILNTVLDSGITFIDTSPDYGKSEELIGATIAHRRGEYFLASKCGCVTDAAPKPGERPAHVFTRENIRKVVEQSLRRLKTDHLDLVQFHASPSVEQLEEHGAIEELRALQAEGKVRFLGMSGTLPNLRDHIRMGVFDAFQIPYSALQREHEAAIAEAAAAGAGIVIRGGVARGTPSDWQGRSLFNMERDEPQRRWNEAKLDDLLDGMSRMEFTLRFTLSHPDLHTTIVGTKNPEHLRENVAAAVKGPLPASVVKEAKERLASAGSVPE